MILQAITVLGGLLTTPAPSDTGLTLTGTWWQLIEFVSFKYDSSRLLECNITIRFNKGKYEGRYGPNAYAGTYQITGKGRISINYPTSTKNPLPQTCRLEDSNTEITIFHIMLLTTARFDIISDKIYLKGSDGDTIFIFRKAG